VTFWETCSVMLLRPIPIVKFRKPQANEKRTLTSVRHCNYLVVRSLEKVFEVFEDRFEDESV
jgi:hypothetical protein